MNLSEENHGEEHASEQEWYFMTLKILVTVIGVFGSAFVLTTIARRTPLQNQNGIFIFSVCLSDFLQSVTLMPINLYSEFSRKWPLNQLGCDLVGSATLTFMIISVYSLLGMNVDKSVAIFFPYKYKTIFSIRKVVIISGIIWIISFTGLFGGIMVLGGEYVPYNGHCMPDFLKIPKLFIFVACFLLFALILVGILNVSNLVVAWRQSKKISDILKNSTTITGSIRKGIITTSLLVSAMYITWSPTLALLLLEFSLNKHAPNWLENSHIWLQFANSTLNIFVYIVRMKVFRREIKRLFGLGKYDGSVDNTDT